MSEATILGRIRQMAGGSVDDLSGTILEALDALGTYIGGLVPRQGEVFADTRTNVTGTFNIAHNSAQRYGGYTEQAAPAVNDAFELSFYLAAGTYTLSVLGITGSDEGICKWALDGVDVVIGQDWYSAGFTFNVLKTATITVTTSGLHTLRATVTGKNASSSNHYLRVGKVHLKAV